MTLAEATALLQHDTETLAPQTWADLGAGSGTFTLALANLLPPGSVLYAIDNDAKALASIPDQYGAVTIRKYPADFVWDTLPFQQVDGFLLANSLHYVREKNRFLEKLKQHLTETGRILLVEYDTDKPNLPWVPYPISYQSLAGLFQSVGFTSIRKLSERRSIYGRANLYAALIR